MHFGNFVAFPLPSGPEHFSLLYCGKLAPSKPWPAVTNVTRILSAIEQGDPLRGWHAGGHVQPRRYGQRFSRAAIQHRRFFRHFVR